MLQSRDLGEEDVADTGSRFVTLNRRLKMRFTGRVEDRVKGGVQDTQRTEGGCVGTVRT